MSERYNVVLEGKVRAEANRDAVVPDLAALVGRDEPFARELLSGQPVVLRSNVSRDEADDAVAALVRIGVLAHVEQAPEFRIDADVEARLNQRPRPELWNPNAAANWSLIFTPVFGSWLHLRNWRSLHATDKVGGARAWLVASIVVLVATILVSALLPVSGNVLRLANFIYLLVWYFVAAKPQASLVKRDYGRDYIRKGWGRPLLLGVIAIVATAVFAGWVQQMLFGYGPPPPGTTRL